jgi:hypothetical protein
VITSVSGEMGEVELSRMGLTDWTIIMVVVTYDGPQRAKMMARPLPAPWPRRRLGV